MRKNKSYLWPLFLLAFGCTKKAPETLLSRWEANNDSIQVVERTLAGTGQGQCLADIFTVETLKTEMRGLEKKFAAGTRVRGQWRHLNLEILPIPQANFLKKYGDHIGDLKDKNAIDYSACQSVPCIFNKIYGDDNSVAGYVHYLWYLKFGHMLSADNMVPGQESKIPGIYNSASHPLSQYLFNNDELFGFWRLSFMLKAPHTTLTNLNEIQRIPRGVLFEGTENEKSCGIAWSGRGSDGNITLTDGCLRISGEDKDEGSLYLGVTHELNHHIDFLEGRGTKAFYRSLKPDYLDLAGMVVVEYVDNTGVIKVKYENKPGFNYVRDYAKSSPMENFADTMAFFRLDGELTKKTIKADQYDFFTNDYHQNRSFDNEALINTWIKQQATETSKSVFKAVVNCKNSSADSRSNYFKPGDFSVPVLPGMLNCFGQTAEAISQDIRSKTLLYEPQGCEVLKKDGIKVQWNKEIKKHLVINFERYLQELQKDKDYLARIETYYSQISNKTVAKNAFIGCYSENDDELCYEKELNKLALEKAQELNLLEEQTIEMVQLYVSYHPYGQIKEEVMKSYRALVTSNLEPIKVEAQATWEGCRDISHNDDQSPRGHFFNVSDGYMISSFYNCLNQNIPEAIKKSARNFSVDNLKLQHAKEELILFSEIRPHLLKSLYDFYNSEREKELFEGIDFLNKEGEGIRNKLLANLSWAKKPGDDARVQVDCIREGLKLIPFKPLYNSKSGLFKKYLETNSCNKIQEEEPFIKSVNNSEDSFNEKVSANLEEKMMGLANSRALVCLEQFPINGAISIVRYRRQRESCLLEAWPQMETTVLNQTMNDPLVKKLQLTSETIQFQLGLRRRSIQGSVLRQHFKLF